MFVLHDVFGCTHGEIAAAVGPADGTARVPTSTLGAAASNRNRPPPERSSSGSCGRRRAVTMRALMDLLAPDAVVISDSGGKVVAVRRPVVGRDDVARLVLGVHRTGATTARAEPAPLQRHARGPIPHRRAPDRLVASEIGDGRLTALHGMRNPDKPDPADVVRPLGSPPHDLPPPR